MLGAATILVVILVTILLTYLLIGAFERPGRWVVPVSGMIGLFSFIGWVWVVGSTVSL